MNDITLDKTDWKRYENIIYEECKIDYPNARIQKDVHIKGRYSKRSRQIDILLEQRIKEQTITTIIDCKYYNRKVDVKKVEAFIGMVDDLDADRGIIISDRGYTKAALDRAYYNPRHIELDIYSLNEFKEQFQSTAAFPYSGEHGVFLMAPLGYCIDGKRNGFSLCTLYQKGLTFEEAANTHEFAYTNIVEKDEYVYSIFDLNDNQILSMKDYYKTFNYEMIPAEIIHTRPIAIRVARYDHKPFNEVTGIIDFTDFLFFVVWFCLENTLKRTLRKMELLLSRTIPINVAHTTNE